MIWEAITSIVKGLGDTLTEVIKTFHLDPEAAIRLEQEAQRSIMEFQRKLWELEVADRDSARKREIAHNDPTTHRLAYLYTGGYFCTLGVAWYYGIPEGAHDMLVTLLGVLTAAQMAIVGYYFGSSHSSSKKDEVLGRVVNHKE
jgi:hypothetical protein